MHPPSDIMSLLSDSMIKSGKLVQIEPLHEVSLTPNGYDVTIAEVLVGEEKVHVSSGTATIPPKSWFAVSTEEYFKMGPMVAATIWLKTRWARKCVISSFGMVDAGFEGNLTLSAFNSSHEPLDVGIGDRFAQVVFHMMEEEPKALYDARSGNFQGQKGITLEKIEK